MAEQILVVISEFQLLPDKCFEVTHWMCMSLCVLDVPLKAERSLFALLLPKPVSQTVLKSPLYV